MTTTRRRIIAAILITLFFLALAVTHDSSQGVGDVPERILLTQETTETSVFVCSPIPQDPGCHNYDEYWDAQVCDPYGIHPNVPDICPDPEIGEAYGPIENPDPTDAFTPADIPTETHAPTPAPEVVLPKTC